MDTSTDQPHSPSARFYANRQSAGPAIFDMLSYPAVEQQHHTQLVPPFNDFQGFSATSSSHRHLNNTCAACLSDDRVSPRTPIPYHDHHQWESPGPDHVPSMSCGSVQNHVGGLAHTQTSRHGPAKPKWSRQLSEPPTYITPPPQNLSSPENSPAPAFAERPVPVMLPPRGVPARPAPMTVQRPVVGGNTIRVPSDSENSDAPRIPTMTGRPHEANATNEPASTADDEVESNGYPYDSTSTASSSTASRAAHGGVPPRPLEEAVLEVHNTCLTATQRYLETLRVNWELRRGRPILTPLGLAGPSRRLRNRAGARGSPYALPRRLRRALSDNNGLEYMRGLRDGHDSPPGSKDWGCQGQQRGCPIPEPTDSLLQNTSHICELIWRRVHRDRDDVLGVESGGVRSMGLLVECAEMVVLYDAAEWERDPETGFVMACQAGRNLCRELGDLDGAERVDGIERGQM